MSSAHSAVATLRADRPEWAPWLHVVEAAHEAIAGGEWDAAVPTVEAAPAATEPVLADVSLTIRDELLRRTFARLSSAARASGSEALAAVSRLFDAESNRTALFAASVSQDREGLIAVAGEADADRAEAVVALLSMPFLHACRRRYLPHMARTWADVCCPICAAWPAFVEVRGIERARHARCNRCGAGWHAQLLRCPYCATSDHGQLVTLIPQDDTAKGSIDACTTCGHYTKVFTTLQGCDPAAVYLEDLLTVDMDVAALEAGYVRPQGGAHTLRVRVNAEPATRRFFGWTAS